MRYVHWEECGGEAHGNVYIDHCMRCQPFWRMYPVCPDCLERVWVRGADARCVNPDCGNTGQRLRMGVPDWCCEECAGDLRHRPWCPAIAQ